jgi:hypothetical protein
MIDLIKHYCIDLLLILSTRKRLILWFYDYIIIFGRKRFYYWHYKLQMNRNQKPSNQQLFQIYIIVIIKYIFDLLMVGIKGNKPVYGLIRTCVCLLIGCACVCIVKKAIDLRPILMSLVYSDYCKVWFRLIEPTFYFEFKEEKPGKEHETCEIPVYVYTERNCLLGSHMLSLIL